MIRLFLAQCTVVSLIILIGAAAPRAAHADATRLVEQSGLAASLGFLPNQLSNNVAQALNQSDQPASRIAQMANDVKTRLADADLAAVTVEQVAAALSEADQQVCLAWYDSADAAEITRLETAAAQFDQTNEIAKKISSLLSNEFRVASLKRIEARLQTTEQLVTIAKALQTAIVSMLVGDIASAQRETILAQINEEIDAQRPALEQLALATLAHTYEPLSGKTLGAYAKALEQEALGKFHATKVTALASGLNSALQGYMDDE